jgi:7-keto-8-aminopelargonate synthetase-like enzyme
MPVMQSPPGAETVIDGRRYLYFAGTGYLGLQGHEDVIRAACEATRRYGLASATTRAGFGNTPPVLDVERQAARLFGTDDSFYFVSGYVGNQVLVLVLDGSFDAVLVDEHSHYCVFEAARIGGRPTILFRHGDPEDLRARLRRELKPGQRPLVLSDGVFAGLGDIAPLAEYRDVLGEYPGAILLIDDAHAIGVLGENGRGTFEHAGLWHAEAALADKQPVAPVRPPAPQVNADLPGQGSPASGPALLMCGTLSKAIGGFGGIVPGSRRFIDGVKGSSRLYGGASAPPIPAAAATARALELVLADPGIRKRLWQNARTLKSGLGRLGLPADDTPVPIASLQIGDAAAMRRIQEELMRRGILIGYMPAYSGLGPEGALRLAVFATHTEAMIGQLVDELGRLL